MSQELIEANLNGAFAVLDTDGDGHITVADFTAKADQMCAAFAPEPQSPHHAALQRAYASWWEQLRAGADHDGDGKVSQAEFVAAIRAGTTTDPRYLHTVDAVCHAVFDAIDTNGDGRITWEEFARMYCAADVQTIATRVAFDHLDTDGDGAVSREEFVAGANALLSSADASQPGTWMLGETNVR
ncbi:EF-hand domain-containing protein [Nonomuraea sp. NPDC005650]|uniref:EF-hand domain-containing protein n=1 Tax=Nonomuraea sp. NPDC005650 TaxID=3157045 RepID=UPI0033B84062